MIENPQRKYLRRLSEARETVQNQVTVPNFLANPLMGIFGSLASALREASQIGCVGKVPALSSEGCRFDPGPWQIVQAIRGIYEAPVTLMVQNRTGNVCKLSLALHRPIVRGARKNRPTQQTMQTSAA